MISIVNGYVCTNCGDAAKAKRGEDPHPSPIKDAQEAAKSDGLDKPSRPGDPAVVFGGALASMRAVNETSAAGATPDALTSPQGGSQKAPLAASQTVDLFA